MIKFSDRKSGVTNVAFAGTLIVLIAVAGLGFGLYGTALNSPKTVVVTNTNVMSETLTQTMTQNYSYAFAPSSGAMIRNALLLTAPVGMNDYAVSIHAEGLVSTGTYLVEGTLAAGSMQTAPISTQSMTMNTTAASEFQADKNGTGLFWIELVGNPASTFENIQLYFLQGGSMQNEMLIATATFTIAR